MAGNLLPWFHFLVNHHKLSKWSKLYHQRKMTALLSQIFLASFVYSEKQWRHVLHLYCHCLDCESLVTCNKIINYGSNINRGEEFRWTTKLQITYYCKEARNSEIRFCYTFYFPLLLLNYVVKY